ncbi:MAG: hypothetical protein LBO71_07385 [Prevotellaceae bacterium]|jgi:hypothetical protein|nr:hypothetical protein [Prevotellaceae bacterium]
MKHILLATLATLACVAVATAQTPIAVGVKVPENTGLGNKAQQLILKKMQQLTTLNSVGTQEKNARFQLTPQVSIVSSDVTPSAPPKQLVKLSIVLMIADTAGSKSIVAQTELAAKGVGKNEEEAVLNALQQVDIRSATLKRFMEQGKKKIAELPPVVAQPSVEPVAATSEN